MLLILTVLCPGSSRAQEPQVAEKIRLPEDKVSLSGYAGEQFSVRKIIHQDMLDDGQSFSRNWIVQQSQKDPQIDRYVKIDNGALQVHDPRGCTIWYTTELSGPVMISYRVMVPSARNAGTDVVPRDINQFWMANTPGGEDPHAASGLFDSTIFNGDFDSYHALCGYYASTGGGNVTRNNRTTRLRRYPRKVAGNTGRPYCPVLT